MAGPLEHDETRSGDRFRKLLLVLDGDDRVQLTRQDQCRATDPSDLLAEIEPSDLISPEMNSDVFAKDRSREDVRISFRRVVVRKTATAILLAARGIRILEPASGYLSDFGTA
jgi:hypothetical protein